MKKRMLCFCLVLVCALILSCAVFAETEDQTDQAVITITAQDSGSTTSELDAQVSAGSDSGNAQRTYLITGGCAVGICILLYIFVAYCNKRGISFSGGRINRRGAGKRKGGK